MRRVLLIVLALVSVPPLASAQGNPLGPEFRVNTFTTDWQYLPVVASDALGNFVVVWTGRGQDGSASGVFGQRFASSGTALGPEFRVNTYTTNSQVVGSVAFDALGNFVISWSGNLQDGSGFGILGQRYASSGTPLGLEFRVNTYTTGFQGGPALTSDASGNFVIVWSSYQDGSGTGVFGQRYASSGFPLGPEFRVNTFTTGQQQAPIVASDTSGNFVVAWNSLGQDGDGNGVFGQRYASSGAPLGPEFRANTYTTSSQSYPSVASDPSGGFVVIWSSAQDGSLVGIFGQRYASSGAPVGPEFRVNTYTPGSQFYPSVAADSAGNFVVVWASIDQDGSAWGVFGQRYAASGAPVGPEFRVNTYTTNSQRTPSVASDGPGNFVVVWESYTEDGSDFGVFGQRYGPIVPVELMRFRVE
jgi:hypothetical protein